MNLVGFQTLLFKEIRRFLKVPGQALGQPLVTTLLYFLIFGYALGPRMREIDGVPYMRFIVPGLILQALIQNAFHNTSSSVFTAKIQGTVIDLLMAPLGVAELLAAFLLASIVRGLIVGTLVWLVAGAFNGFEVVHLGWALTFAVMVGGTFALLGLAAAIWSDKFEQLNLLPTFVITPLTFLGGVFFSPELLAQPWGTITSLNPILYMVEGFRYAMIGSGASSPWMGLLVTGGFCGLALAAAVWMLSTGYKLRG